MTIGDVGEIALGLFRAGNRIVALGRVIGFRCGRRVGCYVDRWLWRRHIGCAGGTKFKRMGIAVRSDGHDIDKIEIVRTHGNIERDGEPMVALTESEQQQVFAEFGGQTGADYHVIERGADGEAQVLRVGRVGPAVHLTWTEVFYET